MPILPNLRWLVSCVVLITAVIAVVQPCLGAQAPANPQPVGDPFAVPDGKPEELAAFIEKLQQERPPTRDEQTVLAFARRQFYAMILAADKLLAAKPNGQQAMVAGGAKLLALMKLKQLGEPGVERRLALLPSELMQAGYPSAARRVRTVLLEVDLNTAASRVGARDVEGLVRNVKEHLAQPPLQLEDIHLAILTVLTLDQLKRPDAAAEAAATFATIFSTGGNPQLLQAATIMEGAARRYSSLHKELDLRGTYLDGQRLDWFGYRGKVVLVMFWASWCEPCKAEIANLKKLYEVYHSRGFEVLGINCDSERQKAEEGIRQQQIPWQNLFETDPKKAGLQNPNAVYYGVLALPTVFLVDKDGRVVSIRARGKDLEKRLERLLGAPASASPSEAPAAK